MFRLIYFIPFLFLSCGQSKVKPSKYGTEGHDLVALMKNRVNPLLDLRDSDSAGKVLDSIHLSVYELNIDTITSKWLLFKRAQHNIGGNHDSARIFLERALQLSNRENVPEWEVMKIKIDQLDFFRYIKKYDSAIVVGNEAYYLAKKIDTNALPMICLKMSIVYGAIDDFVSLRRHLFEGYQRSKDIEMRSLFANNITMYYEKHDMIDSAIYFLRQFERQQPPENKYYRASVYENLGILLARKDSLQEALDYQLKALDLVGDLGMVDASTMLNLSLTYKDLKRYGTAQLYLDSGLVMASRENNLIVLKEGWNIQSQILADQSKFKEAYAALDSAYGYYESEVDSSLRAYGREIETKYAVKEKDDAIRNLTIVNDANKKVRRQQQLTIAATIIAALLLFVLINLYWRRRQLKMRIRETELRQQLLRSEMDPHFLFNMLSMLQIAIQQGDAEKSVDYLTKFAKLVRRNIEIPHQDYVSISEEIETLESYLGLQKDYFDGLFDYRINAYDGWQDDEIMIPPMLLQPFVENCINHGFRNINYTGLIVVKIEKKPSEVHVTIEDNGKGLPATKSETKVRSRRALDITRERLALLSRQTQAEAKMIISDKRTVDNETGTVVDLIVPFKKSLWDLKEDV